MPVSGPSIITINNNSNWKDASATNLTTNLATNKSNSTTCSWLKSYHSNNTNEQLADILSWLANTLIANQISSPNVNFKEN